MDTTMISAIFPSDCKNLIKISEFICAYAQKLPLTSEQIYEIDLAVDEAATNIIDHAYRDLPPGDIRVKLDHTDIGMTITLEDDGLSFNLAEVPEPDLTGPLESRRERGLGVFLIHKLMDEVSYQQSTPEGNQLTLFKRFSPAPPQTEEACDNESLPAETLRIISEINRSISSTLDLDQLLQKVTDLIQKEFGYPLVHIFLVDYVPQEIVFKAGSGSKARYYEENQVGYPIQAPRGLIALTARTGTIQLANDISTKPDYQPDNLSTSVVGSELCLPLKFQGKILGVLDLQSDQTDAFTIQDVDQLETLSQTISIALRNANLYKTSIWRRNLAERYRECAEYISRDIEPEDLVRFVIEQIPTILPVDFIGFWRSEGPQEALRLDDYWCSESKKCKSGLNITVEKETWFSPNLLPETGLIKPTHVQSDPIQQKLTMPQKFSAVAAPISYQQHSYGVLSFHVSSAGRYGQDSVNICSTFADYIGNSLDKQRVEVEKETQSWLTSILLDLAIETKNMTTLADLTDKIGEVLLELIGGTAVGLVLETENPQIFSLLNLYCPQTQCPFSALPLNFNRDTVLGRTIKHDHLSAARVGDLPELFKLLPQLTENGTVLAFPLQTQQQTLGYLLHLSSDRYKQAEPEQMLERSRFSILKGVSQQAAISLQNIQMLNDRQEEYRISLRLLELGNILTQSESFETALDHACARISTECGLEGLALLAHQQEQQRYQLQNILGQGEIIGVKPGQTFTANEINASIRADNGLLEFLPGENLRALSLPVRPKDHQSKTLAFRLELGEEFYGLLLATDRDFKFTRRRIDFLDRAARQIALAFQNEHMRDIEQQRVQTDQELSLARRIQKTFLPDKLPEIQGYQLAVEWKTARQVGGDFYDIFKLGENKYGLTVADVSDKGLPASLYMTVSRTLLRAVSREFISPARALERVNQLLQLDSAQSFFVTLVYAILDTASGELTYAIAGHNPPFVLDPYQETATLLPRGGIALGLLEPISLRDAHLKLLPGQSIVFYTDGVSEPVNPDGREYGQVQLADLLGSVANQQPEEIIAALLEDLEVFQEGKIFEDDRTVLVIKRL